MGTLPLRKPGMRTLSARSVAAWSTACLTSSRGTSTVSRTRFSGSSSTCVSTRPIQSVGYRATRRPFRWHTRLLIEVGITFDELQLAARNHALPLEALRFDVTPVGLHYLLTHYD